MTNNQSVSSGFLALVTGLLLSMFASDFSVGMKGVSLMSYFSAAALGGGLCVLMAINRLRWFFVPSVVPAAVYLVLIAYMAASAAFFGQGLQRANIVPLVTNPLLCVLVYLTCSGGVKIEKVAMVFSGYVAVVSLLGATIQQGERLSVLAGGANSSAYVGVIAVFLLVGVLTKEPRLHGRILWMLLLTGSLLGVLMSGSRSAFLALILGTAPFLRELHARKLFWLGLAIGAIGLLFLSGAVPQFSRMTSVLSLATGNEAIEYGKLSAELRLQGSLVALATWLQNPWFGAGGGVTTETVRAVTNGQVGVHSFFAAILGDYGLAGAVLLGFFLLTVAKRTYEMRLNADCPQQAGLALGLTGALLASAVFGFTTMLLWNKPFWLVLALIAGLAANHAGLPSSRDEKTKVG